MNLKIVVFIYLSLLISSCYNTVELDLEESERQLVLTGELEAGRSDANLFISTTFSLGSEPIILNNMIRSEISGVYQGGDGVVQYRTRGNDGIYKPAAGVIATHIIGSEYTVRVIDDGLPFETETLEGKTVIPHPGDFTSEGTAILVSETQDFNEFRSSISVIPTPDEETYYHLLPYIKTSPSDSIFLDVTSIDEGLNQTFILSHRDGILIDTDGVEDEISVSLTLRSFSDLDINSLSDKQIYYRLKTVTYDYYQYNKSISRQHTTNQSPFTIPVLSYTQFDNGYGVFSGSSSKWLSIPIE